MSILTDFWWKNVLIFKDINFIPSIGVLIVPKCQTTVVGSFSFSRTQSSPYQDTSFSASSCQSETLFFGVFECKLFNLLSSLGILIVRECRNSPNSDEAPFSSSLFSITTGLVHSTKIVTGTFNPFVALWVFEKLSNFFLHWNCGVPETPEKFTIGSHLVFQTGVPPKVLTCFFFKVSI